MRDFKRWLKGFFMIAAFVAAVGGAPMQSEAAPSIKLSRQRLTLTVKETASLKVSGTAKTVKWSSSNKTVATVKHGKVTAKKAGKATVTAKVGKKALKCTVTVKGSGVKPFLKGMWQTGGSWGWDTQITFTEKYQIRRNINDGSVEKYPIKKIVKTSYGYFVKILNPETGAKFGYRWEKDNEMLNCFNSWNPYSTEGYSGSSSLFRIK